MKRLLKITGITLVVLIVISAIAGVGIVIASNRALNQTYESNDVPNLTLPEGDELVVLIEEGEHIYISRACASCHGGNGGGAILIDNPVIGVIRGSNLTNGVGGVADNYETPSDWVRAIQHGVLPDGRSLFAMPSGAFANMHETEMLAVIAYMESLNPVDNDAEIYQLAPVGQILLALGQLPPVATTVEHDSVSLSQVERTISVEYGATLGLLCAECHGDNYAGAA
ncbi:MAG: cytochrome c, partial [Chloroflexota bacterium]